MMRTDDVKHSERSAYGIITEVILRLNKAMRSTELSDDLNNIYMRLSQREHIAPQEVNALLLQIQDILLKEIENVEIMALLRTVIYGLMDEIRLESTEKTLD